MPARKCYTQTSPVASSISSECDTLSRTSLFKCKCSCQRHGAGNSQDVSIYHSNIALMVSLKMYLRSPPPFYICVCVCVCDWKKWNAQINLLDKHGFSDATRPDRSVPRWQPSVDMVKSLGQPRRHVRRITRTSVPSDTAPLSTPTWTSRSRVYPACLPATINTFAPLHFCYSIHHTTVLSHLLTCVFSTQSHLKNSR